MIPKKIHYCWFGKGEMPQLAQKCIKSWEKYLPDYELILWNEDTFDVNSHPFTKSAYEKKKYAFVTDYVRLYALYNHGGIYMDTDVEVIKNLDNLLSNRAFSGFESNDTVPTGIMASIKKHKIIGILLDYYNENNDFNLTPNTQIISSIFESMGLNRNGSYQILENDFHLYPRDYFCPIGFDNEKKHFTENTYTIHHFAGSWLPFTSKIRIAVKSRFIKWFGINAFNYIKKIIKRKSIR
ncbi:mannosyltransferase OCH1-like enzyme [Bacillus fengqiuensis]|nr:mannosyltransferase OCH1-like enzyme [Bacillus fengqiuensis]